MSTKPVRDNAPAAAAPSDEAAIARLRETFALQQAAALHDPYPTREERVAHLGALCEMLLRNREPIQEALRSDFGSHPGLVTDLFELLTPVQRAQIAIEQLENWMAPDVRSVDPTVFGTVRAEMRYEPKGVVGNIVPWNFPIELSCGTLVEMLAAGNRVLIKPSEYAPASAALLARLIGETFDRDRVAVAEGGIDLARAFAALPWDHLLYTGSTEVGREVAVAATEHLVPLTLELGGKCPAVLTDSGVTAAAVGSILGTKLVKNGQVCVGVDYVRLPREQVGEFVALARDYVREHHPNHSESDDCVGVISDRHLDRLGGLLDDARAAGCEIVELEPDAEVDRVRRRMPLSLVVEPGAGTRVAREEIFGPVLPLVPYDTLDEAIAGINEGSRPLALYVFGEDAEECERVLRHTRSGGACINACAIHAAIPTLGFGGGSGIGRHRALEGFREFSNARAVAIHARRGDDNIDVLYPPYGSELAALVDPAFPDPE